MTSDGVELPDEVWGVICAYVCDAVDGDKLYVKNRKGEEVDKRKVVYKRRLDTLYAIRQTNKQLCRVMSSEFGEELFQLALENFSEVSDATYGVEEAPPTMLWRHKAFFLTELGCQACESHPTTRKPNWIFGVRMCKECLQEHTVTHRELRDDEWTKYATYEELTKNLPHDEFQGWSQFYRAAYTLVRYWRRTVKKRIALLKRAKTPSERERICAAPEGTKPGAQLMKNTPREKRKRALLAELGLLGCELRADSKLCELFIKGFPKNLRDRQYWTAKKVAERMAQMKYIHEYCDEFQAIVDHWREQIDEGMEEDDEMYVTYEVTGFESFGAAVRDLADRWNSFPRQWPWLAERDT